jgi:hypothetical protein
LNAAITALPYRIKKNRLGGGRREYCLLGISAPSDRLFMPLCCDATMQRCDGEALAGSEKCKKHFVGMLFNQGNTVS